MANYEDFSPWKIQTRDNVEFNCNEKLYEMSNFVYRSIVRSYHAEARKQHELKSSQKSTTESTADEGANAPAQTGTSTNTCPVYAPIVLHGVDSKIFIKVLEFVNNFKTKAFHEQQLELLDREKSLERDEVYVPRLTEWEKKFFYNLDEDELMGLVNAADVLEIKHLARILVELPAARELLRRVGDYIFDVDKNFHLIPLGSNWDDGEESDQMDTDDVEV